MSFPTFPTRSRLARLHALLAAVSVLTVLAASPSELRPLFGTGGASSAAVAAAVNAAAASAQQAQEAAQRSMNSLTRATQTLQAMRGAQAAANAAAAGAGNVPNGLTPGGLMPVAGPVPAAADTTGLHTWQGASLPTQTTDASGQVGVMIHQTQSAAILSWQSFNVGSRTTLTFDQQGNANWIALNRVVDPNAAPSQILGQIKSDGTVLVINQNGIIFGAGAQINVGSLIASTLDVGSGVSGSVPNLTILSTAQRNQTFLSSGLNLAGEAFSPAESQTTLVSGSLATYRSPGSILIQNGAQITSADNGYIL